MKSPKLVDENQAAEILNVRVTVLRTWRYQRKHIPFIKFGSSVRYSTAVLEKHIESCQVQVSQ